MTVGLRLRLGNRPPPGREESRSMLDDCGIETEFPDFTRALGNASRSMLDDCGIETAS